jgi:hypothetical protein
MAFDLCLNLYSIFFFSQISIFKSLTFYQEELICYAIY